MSKTQTEYNKNLTGGFLGALLSAALPAVAAAVAPDAISWLWSKLKGGNGIFISKGGKVVKIKQHASGLYLSPHTKGKVTADGLFLKNYQGSAIEPVNDVKLDDLSLYNLFT